MSNRESRENLRCVFNRMAMLAILFVFITLSMLFAVNMLIKYRDPEPGRDAVIILGAGLNGYEVGTTLRLRLDRGIEYYRANPNVIIVVSGGQGPDELIPEALAMKNYLVRHEVSEKSIIMEDLSNNTRENLLFSKEILDGYFDGEYNVVVVTSDFHMLRSMNYAALTGLDAQSMSSRSAMHLLPGFYAREYFALLGFYVLDAWR